MLGKNDPGSEARPIGTIVALSDAIETIAGSDDPSIGGRAAQIFAKIFEGRGMFRRDGGEIVEGFVDAGGEAGAGASGEGATSGVKKVDCGMSSRMRWGMFSWPSGAKVS